MIYVVLVVAHAVVSILLGYVYTNTPYRVRIEQVATAICTLVGIIAICVGTYRFGGSAGKAAVYAGAAGALSFSGFTYLGGVVHKSMRRVSFVYAYSISVLFTHAVIAIALSNLARGVVAGHATGSGIILLTLPLYGLMLWLASMVLAWAYFVLWDRYYSAK